MLRADVNETHNPTGSNDPARKLLLLGLGNDILTDDAVGPKRITASFRDLPTREAFRLILTANRYFAKQVAPTTVVVVPDNPGKRQQYDSLTVQTFYLTDADAKVAVNLLRTILSPEARSRLNNLKIVRPDFAEQLELQLIQLAQQGKLPVPLSDNELKRILIELQNRKRDIKITRM